MSLRIQNFVIAVRLEPEDQTRATGLTFTKGETMEGNGEQHTHEETQRDEHTQEDGTRVETEKTERTEAEKPAEDE